GGCEARTRAGMGRAVQGRGWRLARGRSRRYQQRPIEFFQGCRAGRSGPSAQRKRFMTGQRVWTAASIMSALVLAGVLAACGKAAPEGQQSGKEQPAVKPALTVNVAHLAQQMWPRAATASGAVQAWQEASIGAEVGGLKLAE